ncbi:hypothetical protein R6Z07M_009903 [Ovis aries]
MLPPFGITLGREQLPAALAGAEAQSSATAPAQSLRGGGALVHPLFRPALLPLPPTQPDTPRPSPNRPERIDRKEVRHLRRRIQQLLQPVPRAL